LMRRAMLASKAATKKAAVEAALKLMIRINSQTALRELRGKVVLRDHDDDWFAPDREILDKRRGGPEVTRDEQVARTLTEGPDAASKQGRG
jgi:hypothetical protein